MTSLGEERDILVGGRPLYVSGDDDSGTGEGNSHGDDGDDAWQ